MTKEEFEDLLDKFIDEQRKILLKGNLDMSTSKSIVLLAEDFCSSNKCENSLMPIIGLFGLLAYVITELEEERAVNNSTKKL